MVSDAPFNNYGVRYLYGQHRKKVHTLGWNCTGRKLAAGGDSLVSVWSVDHLHPGTLGKFDKPDCELKGHQGTIDNVAWDPTNEHRLATVGQDKHVRLWDVRGDKETFKLSTSAGNIYVAWHPDGNSLAVGNRNDVITFIDVRNKKMLSQQKFGSGGEVVNEMLWSPDGKYIFVTVDKEVQVRKYPSWEKTTCLRGHTWSVIALALDPHGKYLATGGSDAIICLWDLSTFSCVTTYGRQDVPVKSLSFSADSRFLAVGTEENVVDIETVETGNRAHELCFRLCTDFVRWNPKYPILACNGDANSSVPTDPQGSSPCVALFGPLK